MTRTTGKQQLLRFAAAWFVFAVCILSTTSRLPEQIATHFSAAGQPDGWMGRPTHVALTLLFGAVVPLFVMGIFSLMRRLGGWGLSIPNKQYWLAPERQDATFRHLERQGFWLAGLFLALLLAVHWLILRANAREPVSLGTAEAAWVSGTFALAVACWVALMVGRFFRRRE